MAFNFNPSLWFVCRLCQHVFSSTETLKEHKLACHLGECLEIKCIIFQETLLKEECKPEYTLLENPNQIFIANPGSNSSLKEEENKVELDYDSRRDSLFKNPYVSLTKITEQEINLPLKTQDDNKRQRQDKSRRLSSSSSHAANDDIDFELPEQEPVKRERWDDNGSGYSTRDNYFRNRVAASSKNVIEIKIESSDDDDDDTSTGENLATTMRTEKSDVSVEKPFVCDTCSACFRTRQLLKGHMRTHSLIKPFLCSQCPSQFRRRNELTRHLIIHGEETKFKCRFCSKYFGENRSLLSHERSHTGDRPYKCPVPNCDYAASSNSILTAHTRARHSEELGLEQFLCPKCGKRYGIRYLLEKHIQIHHSELKPFHCTHEGCTKKFKLDKALQRHLKTHAELVGITISG